MPKRYYVGLLFIGLITSVYLTNVSWFVKPISQNPWIVSHRGVHQNFSAEGLKKDTCTAERIYQPRHGYIENTLESIGEAFRQGADMVELDVHLTVDGQFAVFHDWTLDCRTNGVGRTRDYTMQELKQLDVGHGYTPDKGKTFPFRGKFFGAMPNLTEVFEKFPDKAFLINFKSRFVSEGEAMIKLLEESAIKPNLAFTGHQNIMDVFEAMSPDYPTLSRQSAKACFKEYMVFGWSGYIPKSCHNRIIPVPLNYRKILWGWPYKLEKRLKASNSRLMLIGPMVDGNSQGIDDLKDLSAVPKNYSGWIITNKIEVVGPALKP